jgi:hypothetical protein
MNRRTSHLIAAAACMAIALVATPARAQGPAVAQDLVAWSLSAYTPPACTGIFTDVPCPGGFAVNWIEQFSREGITAGCSVSPPMFCPDDPVTRAQMAVFVEKALRGTSNWPPHTVLVFHRSTAETYSDRNSGAELLSLVAAIPSSGPEAPTPADHWLVKVGPGYFDLDTSTLALPGFVDLEGSGIGTTVIASSASLNSTLTSLGTVAVRAVSIVNSSSEYSRAIYSASGVLSLERAYAWANNGSADNIGIYLNGASLSMQESVVRGTGTNGWGIFSRNTVSMSIRNSVLVGTIQAVNTSATVFMATTGVSGPLVEAAPGGDFHCFQNYDPNMLPVSCP